MDDFIQIITTTDRRDEADLIARTLVEKRLAACVQVMGPITSTYRWQGQIETAQEWLCLIKTARTHYGEVEEAIKALHHYETPEILAVPVVAGNLDYLAWLGSEVKNPNE